MKNHWHSNNKQRQAAYKYGYRSGLELKVADQIKEAKYPVNYETETLILERLSTSMMKKLTKAFLHKELYIDNVKYITNSSPENESIPNTNMYNLTVKLTKSGNVFNSEFVGSENEITSVEVIGLLQSEDNYINLG